MRSVDHAVLLGMHFEELGEIEVEVAPDGLAAIAISRGAHKKRYSYTDPNEDAVAMIGDGPQSRILIAIDGHNGSISSRIAMNFLSTRLSSHELPEITEEFIVELFTEVSRAIRQATRADGAEQPESRAAVSIAFLSGSRLQWAAMGDSPIIAVEGGNGRVLTKPEHRFVGYSDDEANHRDGLQTGSTELAPRNWVIVATDGYSDFAKVPSTTGAANVGAVLARGDVTADTYARALVEAAFAGGAGDNVGIALTQVSD
jgi:serine/threonine protein phosphatase PrpC